MAVIWGKKTCWSNLCSANGLWFRLVMKREGGEERNNLLVCPFAKNIIVTKDVQTFKGFWSSAVFLQGQNQIQMAVTYWGGWGSGLLPRMKLNNRKTHKSPLFGCRHVQSNVLHHNTFFIHQNSQSNCWSHTTQIKAWMPKCISSAGKGLLTPSGCSCHPEYEWGVHHELTV